MDRVKQLEEEVKELKGKVEYLTEIVKLQLNINSKVESSIGRLLVLMGGQIEDEGKKG